jgi:hypothetical protein
MEFCYLELSSHSNITGGFIMRKQVVLASIAGLSSAAAAQSASLSIVASQSQVNFGGSFTLSVYADADFGTHITGAAFTLNADAGAGVISSIESNGAASWGALGEDDFGDAGDGNHAGFIMGQIVFLPFIQPNADSALGNGPVFLGSFTVTADPNTWDEYVTWTVGGGIGTFALEIIDVNGNPGGNPPGEVVQIANPDFGSASVLVGIIPAPSSAVVLGLGALISTRRRR